MKAAGKVIDDDAAVRIDELVSFQPTKVAASEDGWGVLYLDKRDGRMWELTYSHEGWHGGGPPALTCVNKGYVQGKYWL